MIYFFMFSLLYLNRGDFLEIPKYVRSACWHSFYPASLLCCRFLTLSMSFVTLRANFACKICLNKKLIAA